MLMVMEFTRLTKGLSVKISLLSMESYILQERVSMSKYVEIGYPIYEGMPVFQDCRK
ncbi:hypothetical protein ABIA61_002171 [Paenibacillus sp. RC21]